MNTQTVKLNGRIYDAVSGALISDDELLKKARSPEAPPSKAKKGTKKAAQPHPHIHASATHAKHQASKTLMRKAVKKPTPSIKKTAHVQAALEKPVHAIAPKRSVHALNPARIERANHYAKSPAISRYGKPSLSPTVTYATIPVQAAPQHSSPVAESKQSFQETLNQAVENATHFVDMKAVNELFNKKRTIHYASVVAGSLAVLLLIGFATFLRSPSLQIQIAGVQAGVQTAQVDFSKTDFVYKGVAAKGNQRVFHLQNGTADFYLSEQATNWSDRDMIRTISSVAANGAPNFEMSTIHDLTVYRLQNGAATWIKNGVWYQLTGDGYPTDAQLSKLIQNT